MDSSRAVSWALIVLGLGAMLAVMIWTWRWNQPVMARVRVMKLHFPTGGRCIRYDIYRPDGSSQTYNDIEPFGTLNEVIVATPAGQSSRYYNDPEGMFKTMHSVSDAITTQDDLDYATLVHGLDIDKRLDALLWKNLNGDGDRPEKEIHLEIDVRRLPASPK